MRQRKRKHTFNDIFRYYREVKFTLKVQGDNSMLWTLTKFREYKPWSCRYHDFRENLWPYFKLYIPTLTLRATEEMFKEMDKKRAERKLNYRYVEKAHGTREREFNHLRLYPLGEKHYQAVAERIYAKRGCPTFNKRKITGVIWGTGRTDRKIYHGQRENTVYARYVGVTARADTPGKFIVGIQD